MFCNLMHYGDEIDLKLMFFIKIKYLIDILFFVS